MKSIAFTIVIPHEHIASFIKWTTENFPKKDLFSQTGHYASYGFSGFLSKEDYTLLQLSWGEYFV